MVNKEFTIWPNNCHPHRAEKVNLNIRSSSQSEHIIRFILPHASTQILNSVFLCFICFVFTLKYQSH